MLTLPLILVLGIGGLVFHRSFYTLARTFITRGVPDVWSDHVANTNYWQAFQYAIKVALLFPIIGIILALWVARSDTDLARTIVIFTFLPSAAIFGAILISASVLAAIGSALFMPGEENRQAIKETRIGIQMEASGYLMWELMVGLFLYEIGIDATMKAIVVSVWGLILYGLAAYRYGWKVTWTPYVATWLGLGTCIIVAGILTTLLVLPASRPLAVSIGIDPSRILHKGAVDTSSFDKSRKLIDEKMHEFCGEKVLEGMRISIATAQDVKQVLEKREDLDKRERECIAASQYGRATPKQK